MYVEAYKQSHVMEAVRGLRNVLTSKGAKLVPLTEMVDAITVNTRAKKSIGRPQFLFLNSSILHGDTRSQSQGIECFDSMIVTEFPVF